jgi:hypothetical protein
MNTKSQNTSLADPFKHLPHYAALQEYGSFNWACFGGLSHKYPTSVTSQLAHVRTLMDTLGSLNGSFGRRLHWVVRAEKNAQKEIHLHFLLGGHKVTDGHKHRFSPKEACDFLEKNWEYGTCDVRIYDSRQDGLGYVLKSDGRDAEDIVELSPSLTTFLKKKKADAYFGRDPLAVEIIHHLRSVGTRAGFGDEMESLRRGAA